MEPPGFAGREVRVFLPSRFEPRVPTPALFLFDGQNVFEGPPGQDQGWFVHEAIEGMDPRWNVAPLVVAIPSGTSWDEREAELTPWPTEGRGGRADAFLDWVVHAVVPRARERFLLPEGALGAVVGGVLLGWTAGTPRPLRLPAPLWRSARAVAELLGGKLRHLRVPAPPRAPAVQPHLHRLRRARGGGPDASACRGPRWRAAGAGLLPESAVVAAGPGCGPQRAGLAQAPSPGAALHVPPRLSSGPALRDSVFYLLTGGTVAPSTRVLPSLSTSSRRCGWPWAS